MDEEKFKAVLALPEINASGIANKMFGEKQSSRSRLNDKINKRKSGNGHQRLTEDDLKKGEEVLRSLANDILEAVNS